MAEIWELTQYVEAHPDNKGQRWRLAKKLYKEGDYRMAIEHLQILSNEWADKSGVPRYLAATYMRLGRSEEAVKVLEQAMETWPTDARMREQLALMYASNGQKEEAAVAWAEVLSSNPEHSFAKKAGTSIVHHMDSDHQKKAASNPAGGGGSTVTCTQCGAENTPEQLSCMTCNASLDLAGDIIGELSEDPPERMNIFPSLAKISIVSGLIYGSYKTISASSSEPSSEAVFSFPQTLHEAIAADMLTTHVFVGLVVLIAWPFLNQGAQYAAGVRQIYMDSSVLQSLVFGVFAYVLSWLPGVGVTAWTVIMLGFTLAVTAGVFRKDWKHAIQIWLLQCAFVGILIVTLLGSMHGMTMVRELRAVESFIKAHPTVSTIKISGETPITRTLRWDSTGSIWADGLVDIVGIRLEVSPDALNNNLSIEFRSDGPPILYQPVLRADTVLYAADMEPGTEYTLLVTADEPTAVNLTVSGVFPLRED